MEPEVKPHFKLNEVLFPQVKSNIALQFTPNIVLDSMTLMERTKRDVHKLVCLFLVNGDRKFSIQVKKVILLNVKKSKVYCCRSEYCQASYARILTGN